MSEERQPILVRKQISRTNGQAALDGLATGTNATEQQTENTLRELRARREKIGDQLGAFERASQNQEEIRELTAEIEAMETDLEGQKQEAGMNKTEHDPAIIRKSAEDLMDQYAKSLQKPDETFEAAYTRACFTDLGSSILAKIDTAYRRQTGQATY